MRDGFAPSVHFSAEDYARLRETYRKWWAGELDRPIVSIVTGGHGESCRDCGPLLRFGTAWDVSISPEMFVEAHDRQFAGMRFHGDAFPFINFNGFGPGVLAAFLGCTPVSMEDTVWFKPPRKDIPIEELHFEMDEDNPYFRRVLNIYEAAMEKWRGSVVLGMADLGGVADVLSSFRGNVNLLMDLYDSPEEVLRCIDEIQKVWFRVFDKINALMGSEAMGYSHWFGIYCDAPSYILQSDFSYMIGPEMFDTFIAPELKSSAARLPHAQYHMDGMGQIPHLDSLLKMDDIHAIQWVPGAGEPERKNWDELLGKIAATGRKLLSHRRNPDDTPIDVAGAPGQALLNERYFDDMERAKIFGARYGIEVE